MDGHESNFSDFFGESELCDTNNLSSAIADDDIFSILEALENSCCDNYYKNPGVEESGATGLSTDTTINGDEESGSKESFEFQISAYNKMNDAAIGFQESETELVEAAAVSPKLKRQKLNSSSSTTTATPCAHDQYQLEEEGQQRISHITVERNRRKQMNQHLSVLRSLMPCFYVKRGDQASIIGGVVDYINELQQVLQSLESKKQRKAYAEVILSPRPSPLSPRKPPLSPRLSLPISPRTPQPSSPYKPPPIIHNQQSFYLNSPSLPSPVDPSPCNSSTSSINDSVNELVATSKSALAEVEVKFSGPNLLLNTVSHRIPGQVLKIISVLEELALEILRVNISTVDEKMLNSFTIKIGIECQLSAEELAQQIQQTFR